MSTSPAFSVQISISNQRIANLLSCAFESGDVHYWCTLGEAVWAGVMVKEIEDFGKIAAGHHECVWLPLTATGGIEIFEHNDTEDKAKWTGYMLNRPAIERGLALMADPANEHFHHFKNFLSGDEDMTTGDVFLQFCVLGEVKYG